MGKLLCRTQQAIRNERNWTSVCWDTADLRKGGFVTLAITVVGGQEGVAKLYTYTPEDDLPSLQDDNRFSCRILMNFV